MDVTSPCHGHGTQMHVLMLVCVLCMGVRVFNDRFITSDWSNLMPRKEKKLLKIHPLPKVLRVQAIRATT